MNKEVVKAMNRRPKEKSKSEKYHIVAMKKWWKKHRTTILRIVLFPLWILAIICEKANDWQAHRNRWNEERAKEILDYYIPRRAEWCADEKEFYFFDNGYGWSINLAKKYLKIKDRAFWKHNTKWYGGKMSVYLVYHFELEGFTKEVLNDSTDWTEIVFKLGG